MIRFLLLFGVLLSLTSGASAQKLDVQPDARMVHDAIANHVGTLEIQIVQDQATIQALSKENEALKKELEGLRAEAKPANTGKK